MKHPFASTNDPVVRPARRGFLQASGLVLSGTAIALLAGREALATEVQDVTAMRHGIDETHRRFADAFNRGDAAGVRRGSSTRGMLASCHPGPRWWMAGTGSPSTGPQPRPRRRWASGGWSCPRSTCSRWAMMHTRSDAPR